MDETTRPGTARGSRAGRVAVLGLTGLLVCGPLAVTQAAHAAPARTSLTGLFRLQTGTWSGGVHGSYFRMLQPDGKTYLTNTSSTAGNKTYTLLRAGTDGGLRTGAYQTTPKPAFAKNGDARAGKITAPTDFFGVKFATASNRTDPQTGQRTALPVVYATGTKLSGNLSAFAASWNNQHFNQGAPKPNGKSPGFTRAVSGTYNAKTKVYSITWRSLIVGGPFDKFTGEWHLKGTFVPVKKTATATPPARSRTAAAPTTSARRANPSTASTATTSTQRSAAPTASPSAARTPKASPAARRTASRAASIATSPTAATTAATSAAPRLTPAAQTTSVAVAAPDRDGGVSRWPIVGGVAVLVLFGLVAFRIARTRARSL